MSSSFHRAVSPLRRSFLKTLGSAGLCVATPALARVTTPIKLADERDISMSHLHTAERISLVYAEGPVYLNPALSRLNLFLRDHYTQDVGVMDPALFDILHDVRASLGVRGGFEIISGYRSPKTNDRLRKTRGGGVAKRSLHMEGRAIDVRLPGVPLAELRDAAKSLKRGGVGYYPHDGFVHVDTGAVRYW